MRIVLCWLYPNGMNIYGDRGNIVALQRRAEWRGIDVELRRIGIGDTPALADADIAFIGGGQDREQVGVSDDLQGAMGKELARAAADGLVILGICGGYQLLGHWFRTAEGATLPGVGIIDAETIAGQRRFIGDIIVEADFTSPTRTLVGFENHSGRTYLGPDARPLGRVLVGNGNNGQDGMEGAVQRNAFGCYLHGSLLPKNPWFTDHLLQLAIERRTGMAIPLEPLDDTLEVQAHEAVIAHVRRRGRIKSGAI